MKAETYRGVIEYHFERRKYGTGASQRFFTWLQWRKVGSQEWQSYGDPWPKVKLNKVELAEALAHCLWLTITVGDRVRIGTGAEGEVVEKIEWTGGNTEEGVKVLLRNVNEVHFVPSGFIVAVL